MSSGSSNAHFSTDGCAGIDLTVVDGQTALRDLGETVTGTDSTRWVYVQASGAITAYDWVAIEENFQAVAGTTALADVGHKVGFAQFLFADNDYGFVAIEGSNIQCRVGISCAADINLYTTSTAGVLDDATTSVTNIVGVSLVVTNTTAVAAGEVIATYPRPKTF